ncbi:hypothetical protein BGX30_001191 [Mortierella sp. GBA39]|nr:hypothetical protein BGX30_001191 [Mortierella sp. GBA39]
MPIQETQPHLQAIRRVNENGDPTSTSNTIIHLVCHQDTVSGKYIILWDDIPAVLKDDVIHVRSGTGVLPYLKDPNFKNYLGYRRQRPIGSRRVIVVSIVVEHVALNGTVNGVLTTGVCRTQLTKVQTPRPRRQPPKPSLQQQQQQEPHDTADSNLISANVFTADSSTATAIASASREPFLDLENLVPDAIKNSVQSS